jgi:Icc-related predicted phosphoesterase
MLFQFCSDLHLEFPENAAFLRQNPIRASSPVLILGGDILPFPQMHHFNWFFDSISGEFDQVYWIPGNHEYYFDDASARSGAFQEFIRPNVLLCNQHSLELNGYKLLLCTLWSNIQPKFRLLIQHRLSDFHVVRYGREGFTPEQFTALHRADLRFLREELQKKSMPTGIVTHHAPTFHHYNPSFQNDPVNQAFGTELSDFILEHEPAFWLFGHTHYNPGPFKLGLTQLETNQLGYLRHGEQKRFDLQMVFGLPS